MKARISRYDFKRAFKEMGREDNFTSEGLEALFDYFEALEENIGEEIELDVISICCDYNEYGDLKEFQEQYEGNYETIEDIEGRTTVIRIDGESFITQVF